MGLPRRKKTRLKMLMMIASSSIMVASLATATMAWYSVSVNISVSSSTITIRTPFQYYFYAYKENGFSIKTSAGGAVTTPASTDVFTKGNGYKTTTASHLYDLAYYTEVDALRYLGIDADQQTAFVDALTEVSGLWPGYKMSFAIKATGLASDDAPRLKITALDPGKAEFDTNNDKTVDLKRVSSTNTDTDKAIYMAQAIQIYAKSAATFQAATTNTTAINTIGADTNWWSTPINLGGAATSGGGDGNNGSVSGEWWYFWTIEFSNDDSTFYGTPTFNTTEGVTTETYAKSTSGDSNAYQGLEFKINTMTLQNN